MRIVFMGTPEFAVPSLRALIESGENVVAVVTQRDKPKGRGAKRGGGRKLAPPPVKILAESHGITVLQPEKIKTGEFLEELSRLKPDLICVTAYGKILPKAVLELPVFGCINVHASLLPKLRGAAPINWAIARGCKTTGVTTMLMDEGMDTGDVLLKEEAPIDEWDTAGTLSERLSRLGGELLVKTLAALKEGTLKPVPQDDAEATYAPILKKEMGKIDWGKSAEEIRNKIRGFTPWPGTFTTLGGKVLKLFRAEVTEGEGTPGSVIESADGRLVVATGEGRTGGALSVLELQIEGGKRLETAAFLRGHKIEPGTVLGVD